MLETYRVKPLNVLLLYQHVFGYFVWNLTYLLNINIIDKSKQKSYEAVKVLIALVVEFHNSTAPPGAVGAFPPIFKPAALVPAPQSS